MKLVYVSNSRLPSEKAHPLQLIKMCEAFSENNIHLELIVPRRINDIKEDIFSYYSINKKFKIKKIFNIDLLQFNIIDPLPFYLQSFSFSIALFFYLLFKKDKTYYCREIMPLYFLTFIKKIKKINIFFELHDIPNKFLESMLLSSFKHIDGIIVISNSLREYCLKNSYKNIILARDAADPKLFDIALSKTESRKKLSINYQIKMIVYTGHLYDWKGVKIATESTKYLPNDYLLYLVGGTKEDTLKLKKFIANNSLKNIIITGHVKPNLVPIYLKAADVAVLPNISSKEISEKYTSPLKLFEYMLAKVPIVASDIPSLREILKNSENALLVQQGDPQKLAEAIIKIIKNKSLSKKLTNKSYTQGLVYSWNNRSKEIITFIRKTNKINETINIIKNTVGLKNPRLLSDYDKKKILELENSNNLGVLEAVKRDITIMFTHDSKFRQPTEPITIKKNDKLILPPISFPEIKEFDVVSSSPSKKVHEYLVEIFNLKLTQEDATLLLGYNINKR